MKVLKIDRHSDEAIFPNDASPHSSSPRSRVARLLRSRFLQLVLFAFIVYNTNLRSVSSFDTYPTRLLPISIIKGLRLDLDEFQFLYSGSARFQNDTNGRSYPYFLVYTRGHYMSRFPVMTAILSVPVYLVPVLLGLTNGPMSGPNVTPTEIIATFLSKLSASIAVALSVGFIYLALLRLTSRRAALAVALIYAFATSSWSVSSQGLWQTSASQSLLALTLYFLVKACDDARSVVYASIPLALSVASRPTTLVFGIVFTAYVAWHHRSSLRSFLVFPLIVGALLIGYNEYYFGNLAGPYAGSGLGGIDMFGLPQTDAFFGLLVSPSRGLLSLSPVLLFSCVGVLMVLRDRTPPLLVFTALAILATVLLYSSWPQWDGAFSYSYRFLVDLLPGLALFLGVAWTWIVEKRWRAGLLLATVAFSVGIQVIGAFYYPCGWLDHPTLAITDRARFWDWRDPEFARCLQSGPVDPDGLQFARQVLSHRK